MNTLVFTDDWTFILNALIAPLLAALTYIYIYPIPARWFYGYTLTQQLEQNRLKQRLEDTELLTVEQSKALKVRLYELTKNHAQDLERLREEIEILEQRLKSREVTHEEKSHEYAGFEHEELLELRLQNLMHSVLKEISHRNEGMDISTAKKSFDADSIEVEHAIDKLLDKEMIDEVRFRHSGRLFLTPSGREALIKGRFLTPDQRLGL